MDEDLEKMRQEYYASSDRLQAALKQMRDRTPRLIHEATTAHRQVTEVLDQMSREIERITAVAEPLIAVPPWAPHEVRS